MQTCPVCGKNAHYVGFNDIECANSECKHFNGKVFIDIDGRDRAIGYAFSRPPNTHVNTILLGTNTVTIDSFTKEMWDDQIQEKLKHNGLYLTFSSIVQGHVMFNTVSSLKILLRREKWKQGIGEDNTRNIVVHDQQGKQYSWIIKSRINIAPAGKTEIGLSIQDAWQTRIVHEWKNIPGHF